jgi:hypothetical protein
LIPKSHPEVGAIKQIGSLSLSSKALGILAKTFTEKGNRIQFRAKGNSMFPIIRDGDSVAVFPYVDASPESGDIVAYIDNRSGGLIIHRLMSLSAGEFVSKGDSCFRKDLRQPIENIIGYVSTNDNPNDSLYGINYRKYKKYFTLFSKIGLTPLFAKTLKAIRISNYRS